jgi:hypothetical protein
MIPFKSLRPTAVPKTLEVRLELLKAIGDLMAQARPESVVRKYDPNQPRVPAGNPDGGQWTSEGGDSENNPEIQRIIAAARQLAASRASMNKCVDLCYPLLERFQPPGSDRNEFDFRKCLNECLGLNR